MAYQRVSFAEAQCHLKLEKLRSFVAWNAIKSSISSPWFPEFEETESSHLNETLTNLFPNFTQHWIIICQELFMDYFAFIVWWSFCVFWFCRAQYTKYSNCLNLLQTIFFFLISTFFGWSFSIYGISWKCYWNITITITINNNNKNKNKNNNN